MVKKASRVKKSVSRQVRQIRNPEEAATVLEEISDEIVSRIKDENERRPGKIINGTKIPWTLKDYVALTPPVSFTPEKTRLIIINGVEQQFISGVNMITPKIFVDRYHEIDRIKREKVDLPQSGYINDIQIGAGALVQ